MLDRQNKEFTERTITDSGRDYFVLWYDAKMKNYLLFIEFLHKKKFIQARVNPVLVVDKLEYMNNIEKIKNESKDEKMKQDVNVMLRKEFSDQEKLIRTF